MGDEEDEECPNIPNEPDYGGWFADVETYDGTCDFREESDPSVRVGTRGAEADWEFLPEAIAISPDTTVTWEWTGRGGEHDVVAEDGSFESELMSNEGETFEHTFEEPRIYEYYCTPHRSVGMKGAVFVALE